MQVLSSVGKIFIAGLFVPFIAFGQATLRGSVTDSANNESLIGASVLIQGTSLGAATDIDGKFRISGIPERVFSVKVSYVGYEPKIIEIDFSVTKDVYIDIHLKPTVIKGEEVVVTAQMRGQLAAINQQITSKTIMNVVSEEKIQELPDANAAEAIGRLPGVSIIRTGGEATNIVLRGLSSKFSNITVDGVKVPPTDPNTRDVDLSMISQGALAGIELYKVLTPDQDADAIAGTVNLVTRKAPSERLIRFDLMGNYNNLMQSANQYDFQARYGKRFFNEVLGIQLQGNLESKIRSKENSNYNWTGGGTSTNKSNEWSQRNKFNPYAANLSDYTNLGYFRSTFTDEARTRKGIQAIFDINTRDSGSVKISGTYNETARDIATHSRTYPGFSSNAYWDYNYDYKKLRTNTMNASVQGDNFLGGIELNWLASYAKSITDNPYDFALKFFESPGGNGQPIGNTANILVTRANNDYSAAACSTGVYTTQNNFDQEKTVYLNIAKKYTIGSYLSGELKTGGKYKEKNRYMNMIVFDDNNYLQDYSSYPDGVNTELLLNSQFAPYYNSTNPAPLSLFLHESPKSRNLLGKYPFKPLIDMYALKLWYKLFKGANNGGNMEFRESEAGRINDYYVTERVSSAYLMGTLNFKQFATLIAGVRVEKESNDYKARYNSAAFGTMGIVITATRPTIDSTAKFDQTIWLPNIHLILRPTEFLNLRFAAYKAIARPDYNLRLPQFFAMTLSGALTESGTQQNVVRTGNKDLKNMEAWNFETNVQIFNKNVGLISVSGFFKRIDNYIHVTNNLYVAPYYFDSLVQVCNIKYINQDIVNAIHVYTSMNSNLAYNDNKPSYAWGLEFEHQMNFSSFSGFLKSLTLSYNISLTRSETHVLYGQTITSWRIDTTRHNPFPPYYYTYDTVFSSINKFKEVKRESEGQPKLYGNVALGYDIDGFSARLSFFYQARSVRQYHYQDQFNIYVEPFSKLDLSLKQQISNRLSVILNINNLLDKAETTTSENDMTLYGIPSWNNPATEELYGRTIDLGIRVSL